MNSKSAKSLYLTMLNANNNISVRRQSAAYIEPDSTVARVTLSERVGIHKPAKKEEGIMHVSHVKKTN